MASANSKRRAPIGQYVAYLAYRAGEGLIRLLPLSLCFAFGKCVGALCGLLLPGYRRLARRNLAIALGGELSNRQLDALTRTHFKTLGANVLSGIKLASIPEATVRQRLEVEGREKVDAAIAEGRGIIYLICHMGNWEILAQTEVIAPGIERSSLYQPLSNPYVDAHVRRLRERNGTRLFDRKAGFYAPIKLLRGGGGVGVLVDQHAGDKGLWCPFFGRLASTTNLAALLARKTGAAMFPIGVYTTGTAQWRMAIGDPLEACADDSLETVTAKMNLALEKMIRPSPADWFWVHNRWKIPKPAFLLARYKRGVVMPPNHSQSDLKPFRILVRSPNWLGDACMAIPAVRAIKRGRPDARVTVLSPEKLAAVWESVGEVDTVLCKPDKCSPRTVSKLVREVGDFDVAILLPNSTRSALELARTGIPRVVGYKGKLRSRLLTQIVAEPDKTRPPRHHVNHYLRIAKFCGANVADTALYAPPSRRNLNKDSLRIGVCAGAEYGPAKRWPLDRFAESIHLVGGKLPQSEWLLFGTAGETKLGAELESRLLGLNCQNLVGKTSLRELMDALLTCHLLLTNDTGTMHLAAFLGVPTVAVFGSTEPAWTGPLGTHHRVIRRHVECSPCFLRECPLDLRCFNEIEPREVALAIVETAAEALA